MACFNDLPFELQVMIWQLVIPHRGMHWLDIEGPPNEPRLMKQCLGYMAELFNDEVPQQSWHDVTLARRASRGFYDFDWEVGCAKKAWFFDYLYLAVPTVWGNRQLPQQATREIVTSSHDEQEVTTSRSRVPVPMQKFMMAISDWSKSPIKKLKKLSPKTLEEFAETQRCRQLSTYTQISALLAICRSSRLVALEHVTPKEHRPYSVIYRGGGHMYKPRSLDTWRLQYQTLDSVPAARHDAPLLPKISLALDIVVLRLYTPEGYPRDILKYSRQLDFTFWNFHDVDKHITMYGTTRLCRVGIEWCPLWATPGGEEHLCPEEFEEFVDDGLGQGQKDPLQLYWLVDGIPRPDWSQYPPSIPKTFQLVMKAWFSGIGYYDLPDSEVHQILEDLDLYQEFEANGRRYYVVFVLTQYVDDYVNYAKIQEAIESWDLPFPGSKALWPEALHDPIRVISNCQREFSAGFQSRSGRINYIMSWEPI